ncbi:MAG: class I SAM-dependent methyltransferase [Firmicutes bacterium]|nr:class I SAM-dependent methyltransferase [Bacillota bacterium]
MGERPGIVLWTAEELQRKYDDLARWYDLGEALPELLLLRRLRRHLVRKARGAVLEVAAGTGKNLPHYPPGCSLTLVDLSPRMLAIAQRRARRLGRAVTCRVMDAQALEFPDGRFDTVVSTLSTCTFPDPVAALREMGRVCREDGRILLLEHGRSNRSWLARWQDRTAPGHARRIGCHWNRDPLELVRRSGLRAVQARRLALGMVYVIEARRAHAADP